ncbi:MAG: FeoA family protein [Candidatus Muiribacteriota bacterium]
MSIVPLSVLPKDSKAEIIEVRGGHTFQKKIYNMGLFVGSVIKVAGNPRNGFIIINSGESRIGIGMGMAHKIFVNPL